MPRFEIIRGELLSSYEPHDLDGAFIVRRHKVLDSTGAVPSERIQWSGPGEWFESGDGVPEGYIGVVLGARGALRLFVVYVQREPTPESAEYERGYRKAFSAKRKPVARQSMTEREIEGLLDGWRDQCAHRAKTH
jgi:hypothetical protein